MLCGEMHIKTKAFTVIELVVAVIVVSILVSYGGARYMKFVGKTRAGEGKKVLLDLYNAQMRYRVEYRNQGCLYAGPIGGACVPMAMFIKDIEIGKLKYFTDPSVCDRFNRTGSHPGYLANVKRMVGTQEGYILYIDEKGRIDCMNYGNAVKCEDEGMRETFR